MQDFILHKNIAHYRSLLAGDAPSEAARTYVAKLLADEKAKMVTLPPSPPAQP